MCIDERVESVHYARSGKYMGEDIYQGPGYVYTPGCRHLQPWEALDYVRQRENLPHGDYDRQRHQQQFIMAMFKQLASTGTLTDITKFSALKNALGQLLTLDLNGDVADWIFSFKGLRPSDVTMIQTNGGNYVSEDVGGKSYQRLSEDSERLMQALKADQVASFVALHPDWVASTGGSTTSPRPGNAWSGPRPRHRDMDLRQVARSRRKDTVLRRVCVRPFLSHPRFRAPPVHRRRP
jgi:anionic cell wall polymer biosynthesis LytR-Cps2A-Psr (LCP) family protein